MSAPTYVVTKVDATNIDLSNKRHNVILKLAASEIQIQTLFHLIRSVRRVPYTDRQLAQDLTDLQSKGYLKVYQ
jgi:hypothetical protein